MVKPIAIMVGAAIIAWSTAMWMHSAAAAAGEELETGPKWKIVLVVDGPPGHQEFTYGTPLKGAHWYATQEECEKARKGGDKDLVKMYATVKATIKKEHVPVEATLECRTDDSV